LFAQRYNREIIGSNCNTSTDIEFKTTHTYLLLNSVVYLCVDVKRLKSGLVCDNVDDGI